MIDDATGRQRKRFFASDTTEANLAMLGVWLRRQGRPGAIYADRDSIFRVNRPPSRSFPTLSHVGGLAKARTS